MADDVVHRHHGVRRRSTTARPGASTAELTSPWTPPTTGTHHCHSRRPLGHRDPPHHRVTAGKPSLIGNTESATSSRPCERCIPTGWHGQLALWRPVLSRPWPAPSSASRSSCVLALQFAHLMRRVCVAATCSWSSRRAWLWTPTSWRCGTASWRSAGTRRQHAGDAARPVGRPDAPRPDRHAVAGAAPLTISTRGQRNHSYAANAASAVGQVAPGADADLDDMPAPVPRRITDHLACRVGGAEMGGKGHGNQPSRIRDPAAGGRSLVPGGHSPLHRFAGFADHRRRVGSPSQGMRRDGGGGPAIMASPGVCRGGAGCCRPVWRLADARLVSAARYDRFGQ